MLSREGARLALAVALVVASACARAADPSDVAWFAPNGATATQQFTDMVVSSQYLTMRDGVQIAIDVFLPEGLAPGQRLPTILEQTRYWRSVLVRWPFSRVYDAIPNEAEKRRFVTHGYAWVEADVRGTGASFGNCPTPNFSADQIRDGGEIVDWIVRQPWSNGTVGATGISYAGMTAQLLLVTNHPAVKAVAPRFTQFDEYTDIAFPGGVYFSALVDTWPASPPPSIAM